MQNSTKAVMPFRDCWKAGRYIRMYCVYIKVRVLTALLACLCSCSLSSVPLNQGIVRMFSKYLLHLVSPKFCLTREFRFVFTF